jgi:hypothetical protein
MYHTAGFDREEIIDIYILINSIERKASAPKIPPYLGLFKSVAATLTYMRHNRTQQKPASRSACSSQPSAAPYRP